MSIVISSSCNLTSIVFYYQLRPPVEVFALKEVFFASKIFQIMTNLTTYQNYINFWPNFTIHMLNITKQTLPSTL